MVLVWIIFDHLLDCGHNVCSSIKQTVHQLNWIYRLVVLDLYLHRPRGAFHVVRIPVRQNHSSKLFPCRGLEIASRISSCDSRRPDPLSCHVQTVLIGLLVAFLGVFLTLVVDYEEGSSGTIGLLSLHPITAFSYGLLELGRLEDTGVGVTSDTFNSTSSPSGYTFANALSSLLFDSILYGILTWYLNRVITPDFGQALPFYFPFTAQYWGCQKKTSVNGDTVRALEQTDEEINGAAIPIEDVSEVLRSQSDSNIVVRHLSKRFGDKSAVENLNLTMYNGQVTALLGHNGA